MLSLVWNCPSLDFGSFWKGSAASRAATATPAAGRADLKCTGDTLWDTVGYGKVSKNTKQFFNHVDENHRLNSSDQNAWSCECIINIYNISYFLSKTCFVIEKHTHTHTHTSCLPKTCSNCWDETCVLAGRLANKFLPSHFVWPFNFIRCVSSSSTALCSLCFYCFLCDLLCLALLLCLLQL